MQLLTEQWGRSHEDALGVLMHVQRDDEGRLISLNWTSDLLAKASDLAFLKELTHLRRLNLPEDVTDEGLAHVAGLPNLVELIVSGKQVTDAGLVHLYELSKLQDLYLYDTKVTEAGLARLKKALPHVRIEK